MKQTRGPYGLIYTALPCPCRCFFIHQGMVGGDRGRHLGYFITEQQVHLHYAEIAMREEQLRLRAIGEWIFDALL